MASFRLTECSTCRPNEQKVDYTSNDGHVSPGISVYIPRLQTLYKALVVKDVVSVVNDPTF